MKKETHSSRRSSRDKAVYRYFLKGTNTIVYVGKTNSSVRARVVAHRYEKKFQDLGEFDIEYVELSNKVETDCVEKFLINLWKPILNDKDNVDGLTKNISVENLKWLPYDDYIGNGLSDRQYEKALSSANNRTNVLLNVVNLMLKDPDAKEYISSSCNEQVEFDFGLEKKRVFEPTVETVGGFFKYTFNQSAIDEVMICAGQILSEIWLPFLQNCKMTDDEELAFSLLMEEYDFAERLEEFANNGFEDEKSISRFEMVFDRVSQQTLEDYKEVFADDPVILRSRCSVYVNSDNFYNNLLLCKEKTGEKVLDLARRLHLTTAFLPFLTDRINYKRFSENSKDNRAISFENISSAYNGQIVNGF